MIPLPFIEIAAAAHVWQASLQAGVLILVVLALRAVLGAKLPPHWRVALWLVVFLRLALVLAPPAPYSMFNLAPLGPPARPAMLQGDTAPARFAGEGTSMAQDDAGTAPAPARSPAAVRARRVASGWVLLGAWALGAACLVFAVLAGQRQIALLLGRARPCVDDHVLRLLDECRAALGVGTPISALESEHATSPVLIGALRPALLLSTGLAARLGREGLRAVLMHEVAHVKRRDIAIGWATTLLLILHWFNPLVWIAMSRLRADREMACDALALTRLDAAARSSYAGALIELLSSTGRTRLLSGAAAILEYPRDIARRIEMIASFRPVRLRTEVLAVLLLGAFVSVGLTDAMPAGTAGPPAPEPLHDGDRGAAGEMTAKEVLLRTAKAYRDARTYQDEGEVTTLFLHGEGRARRTRTTVQPFSTAFVRDGELRELFRHESRDGTGRSAWRRVLWCDGERIRSWWSVRPEVREFDEFSLAAAAAGGSGSSAKIPSLLIAGWQSTTLLLADAEIAGVEAVDGIRCIKITGNWGHPARGPDGSPSRPTTLWVDAESFLIRRLFVRAHVDPARLRETLPSAYEDRRMGAPGPPFDTETTITYRPRFDEDVPLELFDFQPPR